MKKLVEQVEDSRIFDLEKDLKRLKEKEHKTNAEFENVV